MIDEIRRGEKPTLTVQITESVLLTKVLAYKHRNHFETIRIRTFLFSLRKNSISFETAQAIVFSLSLSS